MRRHPLYLALVAFVALAHSATAQGTLSSQGFGYPGGQLSTRSLGAGGALSEQDPFSATNPASLMALGSSILYFQVEPEYRTLTRGSGTERSTVARYPLTIGAVPLGSQFVLGLSASNLLDRSFTTESRNTQVIGGTSVSSTNRFTSDGAIGDVRLGLGYSARRWLRLGVAGHVITGDNRLNNSQRFDDTARFAPLLDTATVTYSGTAYSGGFELLAPGILTVGGSYRYGGPLSIKRGDTTLRKGNAPDRLALGVAFIGIRGTTIGARAARDRWSRMQSLAPTQRIADSWDTSVGADVLGPRLLGSQLQLRSGARRRTLPFGIPPSGGGAATSATDVKETSYSFGLGTALARGRATVDAAGIRATRKAAATSARESSWTFSLGISVRP